MKTQSAHTTHRNPLIYLILLMLIVQASACSSSKKLGKENTSTNKRYTAQKFIQQLEDQQLNADFISGKLKISANDGKKSQSFNADFRLAKDQALWLAIYPPMLRIEVARAYITPDSVKIIDRFNKKYYPNSVEYLQQMAGYPVDFNLLQSVILGYVEDGLQTTDNVNLSPGTNTDADMWILQGKKNNYTNELKILKENFTPIVQQISTNTNGQNNNLQILFSNYSNINNKPFAHRRILKVTAPQTYNADITFKNLEINQPKDMPFSVSNKYKKVILH